MYNINELQKDFTKAQNFLTKFGASIQQNNADHASKMVTFAMGHLQSILSTIQPKDNTVYESKPVEKVIEVEPETEVEIYEEDFLLSTD